jgi:hypothetical protein
VRRKHLLPLVPFLLACGGDAIVLADAPGDDVPSLPDPDPAPDPGLDLAHDPGTPDLAPEPASPDLPPDVFPPACTPDDDDLITAAESPVLLGASVSYTVSSAAVVEVPTLQGEPCDAGLCWDFSAKAAGDATAVDTVRPVADFWFAARFPADAFALPLGDSLGVYRKTATSLDLLGLAAAAEGGDWLVYSEPVPLLVFPLAKGAAWTAEVEGTGRYQGTDYPADYGALGKVRVFHAYDCEVSGAGDAKVPAGTFRALRVRTDLRMEVRNSLNPIPLAVQRFRVYDFVTDCLGLVARVRSREGETATWFDQATEYRRLGF